MTEIRPFTISVGEPEVDDLRTRLRRTRWPERETVDDWSQGMPLAHLREVCDHWAEVYDWRRCEALLDSRPNFITEIAGLDIHFQHVRSPHDEATPLIITHGWPGSVVEFQQVIEPLIDPVGHGGEPADAFHLVIPSLPGFGWSAKPTRAGVGVESIAAMWDQLMARLGYDAYVAQGGDWGAAVTSSIGAQDRGRCRAIHVNMVVAAPEPDTLADLTAQEQSALDAFAHYDRWDSGYAKEQSTRPQTLGYALVDSPAGQAAWILEKFWAWTDHDGDVETAIGRDELLDNVSVYWFTATAASSARLYWESFGGFADQKVAIPAGCSVFPKEIIRCSRRWAQRRYRDIRYWNEPVAGGHFAAFERPDLFVAELRAAFRALLR